MSNAATNCFTEGRSIERSRSSRSRSRWSKSSALGKHWWTRFYMTTLYLISITGFLLISHKQISLWLRCFALVHIFEMGLWDFIVSGDLKYFPTPLWMPGWARYDFEDLVLQEPGFWFGDHRPSRFALQDFQGLVPDSLWMPGWACFDFEDPELQEPGFWFGSFMNCVILLRKIACLIWQWWCLFDILLRGDPFCSFGNFVAATAFQRRWPLILAVCLISYFCDLFIDLGCDIHILGQFCNFLVTFIWDS